MPARQLRLPAAASDEVRQALDGLRAELEIPADFPEPVLAEVRRAATAALPGADATDVPFVTIDPPGSKDLDQALHIQADGDGYLVRYAIASVATFVEPGGAIDQEVHERGVTVYGPTGSYPLHPPELSAGVASLLEGQDRPACVWSLRVRADGTLDAATVRVTRARVRSRAQLTYEQVQAAHDGHASLPPSVPADLPVLLRTVGELRIARERARGAVSLDIPEQEAVPENDGYVLRHRATLPVEGWNAQISLLTGIAAARLMREAGVGVLRTLPPADPRDVARLRRTAVALGLSWPASTTYAELLPTLDSNVPAHAAFLSEATTLFRGAGYLAFGVDGAEPVPPAGAAEHAAIAAEYAHVTAPLRRLVDRYGLEVCLAHSAGAAVPDWVRAALPQLPEIMAGATRRANAYERGALDAIEALVLDGRVGQTFDGVVVDVDGNDRDPGAGGPGAGPARPERGIVVLREPAVRARIEGDVLPLGEQLEVRLVEVDVADRKVLFAPA
ncbi:RNB domain-containing ribonuclease [Georgenia yuyongxinii]|uniref:RNB domain-containing ribonuclease n=1 Tax=Georgenia yuyongxinii TaxID=2589797 RepID=A0A5B8C968_9MICO|nr:RNB domain-containing ribonuclease [Georgenia yuyongxinii]QDC26071.1 RNB domain-containing ribonuclease [Georgenia yuyongxinii]